MMEQVLPGVEKAEEVTAGSLAGDSLVTIAIGFTVVFLVLLLLTGVFKLFGMIMSNIQANKAETLPKVPVAPVAPVTAPVAEKPVVGNTETVASTPDVDGGIPAETVAAISAAVASVAPEGTQYAVKGIRKL